MWFFSVEKELLSSCFTILSKLQLGTGLPIISHKRWPSVESKNTTDLLGKMIFSTEEEPYGCEFGIYLETLESFKFTKNRIFVFGTHKNASKESGHRPIFHSGRGAESWGRDITFWPTISNCWILYVMMFESILTRKSSPKRLNKSELLQSAPGILMDLMTSAFVSWINIMVLQSAITK